ncbi:immunoglobulin-like domain-containing protein [Streptomyces sp. NPDC088196]|uniref:immunoglobulin-like domain-containing protein n=1 Tax=Streptomyces sp. NPDC088196 TaxID=3154868 RepID=UPI00344B8F55
MKHATLSRTVIGGLSVAALGAGLLAGPARASADPSQKAPGNGPTATMVVHPVIDTDTVGASSQQRTWASTLGVRNAGGIDAPDSQASYLQFDVSPAVVPGTIVSARVVLTATPDSAAPVGTQLTSAFVSNDTWNGEQVTRYDPIFTLTGATKPAATDIAGSTAPLRTDHGAVRYEGDVTPAARTENTGDGRLSLRVWTTDQNAAARFHSDDHSIGDNRPALLITFRPTTDRDRTNAADAAKDLADAREYLRRLGPVKHDITLPSVGRHGSRLRWSSLDDQNLDDRGKVTRPTADLPDADIALDIKVTDGSVTLRDRLQVVVPKDPGAKPAAPVDAALRPVAVEREVTDLISRTWGTTFTPVTPPTQVLSREIPVAPGQSVQAAIDDVAAAGGGVVRLGPGVHPLTTPLNMRSTVTLVGAGQNRTVIQYTGTGSAITTTLKQLQDVVMKGFTLEGVKGDLGGAIGIYFAGADPESAHHHRIALQDVTVKNFPGHGVHMKRTTDIITDHLTSMYNGEANSLFHNSYWLFDNRILQSDTQLSKPVLGKGAKYTSTSDVITQRMTIHQAVGNGIQADGSNDVRIFFQKVNISDVGKTALWMICEIFSNPNQYTEDSTYAPDHVIINRSSFVGNLRGGVWKIAQDVLVRDSVFDNIQDDLILMKSYPEFENVKFKQAPEYFTDNSQVPAL